MDYLIIERENSGYIIGTSIFDNHILHIRYHLRHVFKPKMFKHILSHLRLMRRKRRLGLQNVSNDDLMNAALKKVKS